MARWKLLNPHYINVPGTKWEYKEVDRNTGREVRKDLSVPMFLDPRDPNECNYKWGNRDNQEGEIIVCHEGKGEPRDIVFIGDPTPDMVPLDDEAKAISAKFEKIWDHRPESDLQTFSQSLVDKFQIEIAAAQSKPQAQTIEGMTDLVSAMTKMAETNAQLIAALAKPEHRKI
jgi:hypothetical protein